jgi:hypothetical protein
MFLLLTYCMYSVQCTFTSAFNDRYKFIETVKIIKINIFLRFCLLLEGFGSLQIFTDPDPGGSGTLVRINQSSIANGAIRYRYDPHVTGPVTIYGTLPAPENKNYEVTGQQVFLHVDEGPVFFICSENVLFIPQ